MNRLSLYVVVTIHLSVIFGNLLAMTVLPFITPWYIYLPLVSLLVNLLFAPVPCPLTRMENKIRRKLGMKEIRYFVGHYVIWPIKRLLKRKAQ